MIILSTLPILTSCGPTVSNASPPPVGLWKSETPDLTLYIDDSDKDYANRGLYVVDGYSHEVVVLVNKVWDVIDIFDANVFDLSNNQLTSVGTLDNPLFIGSWKLRGEKLFYNLNPYFQKQYGIKRIIFENISDTASPEEIFGEILNEVSEEGDVQGERE